MSDETPPATPTAPAPADPWADASQQRVTRVRGTVGCLLGLVWIVGSWISEQKALADVGLGALLGFAAAVLIAWAVRRQPPWGGSELDRATVRADLILFTLLMAVAQVLSSTSEYVRVPMPADLARWAYVSQGTWVGVGLFVALRHGGQVAWAAAALSVVVGTASCMGWRAW